jgi:hypothetical protein
MTIASHELALCEINNGKRYDRRCAAIRHSPAIRAADFHEFAQSAARDYVREFGNPGDVIFTAEDILLCAVELEAYYRDHVAECERIAAEG